MSVEISPVELGFRRPFDHEVVQKLYIKNPHHEPVGFKVKTTAPKQYCVRPNSGRIEAGKEVEVQVLLQAFREDPPLDFRCRDKFLVQSVPIRVDQEYSNIAQIWQDVERNFKSSIQEKKIRVVFLPVDGESSTSNGHLETGAQSSPPPYTSPSPDLTAGHPPPVGPVSKPESKPEGAPSTRDAVNDAFSPATEGSSSVAKTMAEQLAEAKAQILSLTSQLKNAGEQKSVGEMATDAKDKVVAGVVNIGRTSQGPEGVPVQLAAALCLAAFLLAYFFF